MILIFIWYFLKKFLRSNSSLQTAHSKCLKTYWLPADWQQQMSDVRERLAGIQRELKIVHNGTVVSQRKEADLRTEGRSLQSLLDNQSASTATAASDSSDSSESSIEEVI